MTKYREILRLSALGLTLREIAASLQVSQQGKTLLSPNNTLHPEKTLLPHDLDRHPPHN